MDTTKLRELCKRLVEEEQLLEVLKKEESLLNFHGHQKQVLVSFSGTGRYIAVSDIGEGYSQKVIRGREMIVLGIKKAYFGFIEHQKQVIEQIKREISGCCDRH